MNTNTQAPRNASLLPLYQCHKVVRAARIVEIDKGEVAGHHAAKLTLEAITPTGTSRFAAFVDEAWLTRNPAVEVGGYYVEYQEGDRYTAYSPALPFEKGYVLVHDMHAHGTASEAEAADIEAQFIAWWRRACASDGFPGEGSGVSPEMIARAAYHAALCGGFGCRPKIAAVEDQIKIQSQDGNWNDNPYMLGMANGLICAVATFKGEEPKYLTAPSAFICDVRPKPETGLLPHQQRVVAESEELDTKLAALQSFVTTDKFQHLSEKERWQLLDQKDAMESYANILHERIEGFKQALDMVGNTACAVK